MREKPVEERLKHFQDKLTELMFETDIEPIAVLAQAPSAIQATLVFIDYQNPEMMKRFGRIPPKRGDADKQQSAPDTEKKNPLAN